MMNDLYFPVPDHEELLQFVLNEAALSEEAGGRLEQQGSAQRQCAALLLALQVKDPRLYAHSRRVQYLAHRLTQLLHLSKEKSMTIGLAALFHDIGKLALPDSVLQKASRLTPQEFEHIKNHPALGRLILSQVRTLNNVALLVYHHHERWDGDGYPSRLHGEGIPLGARIVAVADAFDAMTSHRVYQNIRPPRQALEELRRCAGTQFDPVLVDRFCTSLEANLSHEQKPENAGTNHLSSHSPQQLVRQHSGSRANGNRGIRTRLTFSWDAR